jgi:hypothetical protein
MADINADLAALDHALKDVASVAAHKLRRLKERQR